MDEPSGDWSLTYKEEFFPQEFYNVLDEDPYMEKVEISDTLQNIINEFMKFNCTS